MFFVAKADQVYSNGPKSGSGGRLQTAAIDNEEPEVGRKGVWRCGRELATVAVKSGRCGYRVSVQTTGGGTTLVLRSREPSDEEGKKKEKGKEMCVADSRIKHRVRTVAKID